MKRTMIFSTIAILLLAACNTNTPIEEQKDWTGTSTYFASSDAAGQNLYYKPTVGHIGDPMPFYDPISKSFKIMYLQEYRPNQVGTYHPFWGVETKNGAAYLSLGELLPCGGINEQDAALGTGSTVYNEADGLYYTFYTAHAYNISLTGQGETVMMATSPDFKTWTKSPTFMLLGATNGYSSATFRDPCVFKGDDDVWHMIVATQNGSKGVLAEYTSPDLTTWTHAGIFMSMMWDRFYECPDVFKMGDYWYLVYSEQHSAIRRVQYFKGHTLSDLKACTANDAGIWPDNHEGFLDSRALYAGKTASDGIYRYLWGWCPTRKGKDNTAVGASPDQPEWGGNLVAYQVLQHEDGTLTLGEIPGMKEMFTTVTDCQVMQQSDAVTPINDGYQLAGDSYVLFSRLATCNKISFTVTTASASDKFGISLVRGSNSAVYYTMVVNPESETARKINFEQEGADGIGFIAGIDGYNFNTPADNVYHVTIYTDNSVLVMFINDVCSYTNRIYGIQRNCWSINSYGNASITVTDIQTATL